MKAILCISLQDTEQLHKLKVKVLGLLFEIVHLHLFKFLP